MEYISQKVAIWTVCPCFPFLSLSLFVILYLASLWTVCPCQYSPSRRCIAFFLINVLLLDGSTSSVALMWSKTGSDSQKNPDERLLSM